MEDALITNSGQLDRYFIGHRLTAAAQKFDGVCHRRPWWWCGVCHAVNHSLSLPVSKAHNGEEPLLSLIHISEPTRLLSISYAVFCLKKKKKTPTTTNINSTTNNTTTTTTHNKIFVE
eukprot:TRINITY_DN2393_c0_g1_i1.p1 TRINITY_DN2393_c0_g1~~TRINITY_DN2393_c0_g1_i1.p1  ORF type:complete len:118 (+),score=23.20 TRINITY_DN2393_c0_g1_i1:313-666(+)